MKRGQWPPSPLIRAMPESKHSFFGRSSLIIIIYLKVAAESFHLVKNLIFSTKSQILWQNMRFQIRAMPIQQSCSDIISSWCCSTLHSNLRSAITVKQFLQTYSIFNKSPVFLKESNRLMLHGRCFFYRHRHSSTADLFEVRPIIISPWHLSDWHGACYTGGVDPFLDNAATLFARGGGESENAMKY